MQTLGQLASLIRSKNAGPFWLTFDILFDNKADYERVVNSDHLTPSLIAELYGFDKNLMQWTQMPEALAVKFSLPRPVLQGDRGDSDMYAGQQYALLVDLPIP